MKMKMNMTRTKSFKINCWFFFICSLKQLMIIEEKEKLYTVLLIRKEIMAYL
jgi:hypothetical protein